MAGQLTPGKRAFITAYAVSGDVEQAERAAGIRPGLGAGWLSNARVRREVAEIRGAVQPVIDALGGQVKVRVRKSILTMSKRERAKALKEARAEMAKLREK